jgi:AAA family ATP:ADP antiporter
MGRKRERRMKKLALLLDIQPGEGQLALLMLVYSFLTGVGCAALEITASSLFIAKFGAVALPKVYIAVALIGPLCGLAYIKLEAKLRLRTLMASTLALLFVVTLGFQIGLWLLEARWLYFALQIWYGLVHAFALLIFWSIANALFTLQQGKRLFGFIGTGEEIAYLLTSFAMPLLVKLLGTANLLCLTIGSLGMSVGVLLVILSRFGQQLDVHRAQQPAMRLSAREIPANRYAVLIFVIAGVAVLGFAFIRYAFYFQVNVRITDAEALASFFGIFTGVMSGTLLIFETFVSGRLLQRFGLRAGLMAMPALVTLLMVVLQISGLFAGAVALAFWIMVATRLSGDMLYQSFYQPTLLLLYQPLNHRQRLSTQAMVRSVVEPLATGMTGATLLLLNALPGFHIGSLGIIILSLMIVWMLVAVFVQREYKQALNRALAKRELSGVTLSLDDASSLAVVTGKLTSSHAPEVIYALDLLEQSAHPALPHFLIAALEHPDVDVRCEVLRRVERLGVEEAILVVQRMVADATIPPVQAAALRAWCALGSAGSVQGVLPYIEAEDRQVQLGAMVGLLRHGGIVGVLAAGQKLLHLVESPVPEERALAARVLGEVGVASFYQPLETLLQDENPQVLQAALLATGQLCPPELWVQVVQALLLPQARRAAAAALVAGGEAVLTEIEAAFDVWVDESEILGQLVQICGRIGGHRAIDLLQTQLGIPDETMRTQILHALSRCGYQAPTTAAPRVLQQIRVELAQAAWTLATLADLTGPEAAIHFFRDVLVHRLEQQRQRIFYLLSFLYDAQMVWRARDNLHHASATLRSYALEVLDVILEQEVKRQVFPLLDELTPMQRLAQLQALFPQPRLDRTARLQACLTAAGGQVSAWLKACALYVVGALRCSGCTEAVQATLVDGHPLVQETATWALRCLQPAVATELSVTVPALAQTPVHQTNPIGTALVGGDNVLSTIEQVLFLRSVDLFRQIPSEDLAQVVQVTHVVRFAPGERFIQQGDVGDSLYLIIDGEVDVVVEGVGTVAHRGAKDVIGDMALLTDSLRTASCVAASDVLALKIEREDFQALMNEKPELAFGIIKVLVQRLEEASKAAAHATA